MKDKRICPICRRSFDRCKCDPEKDWGLKVGSKEEAKWNNVLKQLEDSIDSARKNIEMNEYLIPFIKKRIEEEHEKFKKG